MAEGERRSLVWAIKKDLLTLSADELFQIAKSLGPVPGVDQSCLKSGDEDSCFDFVLERPLLGFNVLEELVQEQPGRFMPTLVTLLCNAMSVPVEKAELLVNLIKADEAPAQCGRLRTGRSTHSRTSDGLHTPGLLC
ncbi:uncharacterized protein LOC134618988 [Pelmatolapia mariae]|uniref:uncharacterized protein LOC134618988 n=1 Tax=Pelmatolapia mariae TaxID=158779 RepID=UPI002FE621C0